MRRSLLRLVLILGLTLLAGCASRQQLVRPLPSDTTVVLVRHTEKHPITKELTSIGRMRAQALPGAVTDLDLAAIYSPDLSRNLDTAAPLAKRLGLKVTVVPESADPKAVAQRLVNDHPGKAVLWVGNVSNLEVIYPALGGTGRPPIYYGDLYVLRNSPQGEPVVETRTFGY